MKKFKLSSVHIIPLSFLCAILLGTLLLALPVSSASGSATPLIDALFTATTSVCVTGLTLIDPAVTLSRWGQLLLLLLSSSPTSASP